MNWHRYSGYAILGWLVFRLLWGFVGSTTSRFSYFLTSPRVFFQYARSLLQRPAPPSLGHNPMGAWSVVLLILLLSAQVGLGLFSEDTDGLESGPLSFLVSYDTARWAAETHEELFNVLLAFIVLHVSAIVFYQFYKKENLLGAMVHGRKAIANDQLNDYQRSVRFAPWWLALVAITVAAAIVWFVVTR